jgi:hypothetical protein
LHLEQRRGVVDGQVARFVVPTLDLGVGYAALAAAQTPALPAANGPTSGRVLDAVVEADRPAPLRGGRQAAAFGPESISPEEARAHEPPDNDGEKREQTFAISPEQTSKLNVLVGKLRKWGRIETAHLYDAVGGRLRNQAGLDLAATTPDYVDRHGNVHKALDDDGTLHWAPLRETLTRVEANKLIDWLSPLEAAGDPAGDEPAAQATRSQEVEQTQDDEQPEHVTVPFNEFPEGF